MLIRSGLGLVWGSSGQGWELSRLSCFLETCEALGKTFRRTRLADLRVLYNWDSGDVGVYGLCSTCVLQCLELEC
jgi:hypothetical protein